MPQKYINSKRKTLKQNNAIMFRKYFKDFAVRHMKNTGLNGYVYKFFIDCNVIDNSNIINIHKRLMKKHNIK